MHYFPHCFAILLSSLLCAQGIAAEPPPAAPSETTPPVMEPPPSQPTPAPVPAAEISPSDTTAGPDDTVITCEGPMHFDSAKGVVVYRDGVTITHPWFNLTGADELKVIFGKGPAGAKGAPDRNGGLGTRFDALERIVATGAIHLLQTKTDAGKPQIEARGAMFTYYPQNGRITLSDGCPWLKQGALVMRSVKPNQSLHIQQSGSLIAVGDWETEIQLETAPPNPSGPDEGKRIK